MVPGLNRLRPRSVSGPAIVMTVAVVVALCTFIHRKPALLGVEPGSSQQMYWMAGVIAAGVVFLIIMGVYHLLNRHAAVSGLALSGPSATDAARQPVACCPAGKTARTD